MKRLFLAFGLVGAAVAAVVLVVGRPAPGADEPLTAEWRPAIALGPGVSAREGGIEHGGTWRVVDLSVDLSRVELRIGAAPGGAPLDRLVPSEAVAAVNGGYFDAHFRPTGWLVDHGQEVAPRQNRATGGVLAVKGADLFVGPLDDLAGSPDLVLQNSPRLVESDGQVGIHGDDGRRAARTVACELAGRLHLVVVLAAEQDGPTLLELAKWLAREPARGGLGCQAALNLDGGPSTGVWLKPESGLSSAPPRSPIAYALAVVPRR